MKRNEDIQSTDVKISTNESKEIMTNTNIANTYVRIPKGVELMQLDKNMRQFYINESKIRMKHHIESGRTFDE